MTARKKLLQLEKKKFKKVVEWGNVSNPIIFLHAILTCFNIIYWLAYFEKGWEGILIGNIFTSIIVVAFLIIYSIEKRKVHWEEIK